MAAVIRLLDSPDPEVRRIAIRAIKDRSLLNAVPELVRRFQAEDDEVKTTILSELGDLASPEARPAFLHGLADEADDGVRRLALRGLVAIDDPASISAAEEFYKTGRYFMKCAALYALERVPTRESSDALRRLLSNERSWRWRWRIQRVLRKVQKSLATVTS